MTVQELIDKLAAVSDRSMEVLVHVPERDSLLGGMSREPVLSAGEAAFTFRGQPSGPTAFGITVAVLPR